MAWSISLPLHNPGLVPADPIPLPDGVDARGAITLASSIRLTDALAIELASDMMLASSNGRHETERQTLAVTRPAYDMLSYTLGDRTLITAAIGLSYRFRIGPLYLEPAMLVGNANIDSIDSSLLLKKRGENTYLATSHRTGRGNALALNPVLTLRYPLREEPARWEALLRASCVHAEIDIPHTIIEADALETIRSESFIRRHTFDVVNIGFGISYSIL